MCTPEREPRASKHALMFAATASLAAATFVGVTVGAAPANAADTTATPATTPVATLSANHHSVTAGHTVTFTVTEKSKTGSPVAAHAKFYVHTKKGWKRYGSKTLSSSGKATFTFKPNYTHAYRVDLASVTAHGSKVYNAVKTKQLTVKANLSLGTRIVKQAAKEKGKPYRYGADGPKAFDCSGLTKYVFHKLGIKLPHNAQSQKKYGSKVSKKNAKPGDLVFVMSGSHATHVAIYAGHGTWWEAPHSGLRVRHVKIWSKHVQYRKVT